MFQVPGKVAIKQIMAEIELIIIRTMHSTFDLKAINQKQIKLDNKNDGIPKICIILASSSSEIATDKER